MALVDDYPALASLLGQDPNYTALGVVAVRAIAADVKTALFDIRTARDAAKRWQAAQPFGPGYQAGYRRAQEDHAPDLIRCLSDNADLATIGGALTDLLNQFDWDNYTGADVMALLAARDAFAAKLPTTVAFAGSAGEAAGATGATT